MIRRNSFSNAMIEPIQFQFRHGIGDCVYLAIQLELYRRRGYRFDLHCHPHREPIFRTISGVNIVREDLGFPRHSWSRSSPLECVRYDNYFMANKGAVNISKPPLPDIGPLDADLWNEMVNVCLPILDTASDDDREKVSGWIRNLPRPIVLLHTNGVSLKGAKDMEPTRAIEALRYVLENTDGSVVLMDWHGTGPRATGFRIRHLRDDFGMVTIPELVALYEQADLLIGIDSGPAHLARFTEIPTLVVWSHHHPATFAMPKSNHVHLVPRQHFREMNLTVRSDYNILEFGGERVPGQEIGRMAVRMLGGCRYFSRELIGQDLQLQQFIQDWSRAGLCGQGTLVDRNKSFDIMVKHLLESSSFCMIETGTVRRREDWAGAGYSTYLFGRVASLAGGELISVDIEPAKCAFSRLMVESFGAAVSVVCRDSVSFLSAFERPVDLLYLDSMDLGVEGFQEHGLAEAKAGYRNVKSGGLIVYDDTHFSGGSFRGKGALGVPWLLEQGCEIVYSGHQTVVRK